MKIVRRYSITLIEVIISMLLTMIVLTALMYFFREVQMISHETERHQNESFQQRYLENRLMDILPKSQKPALKKSFFFTGAGGGGLFKVGTSYLVFTYDNGVNFDPEFSNHVLSRLYIDPQEQLILAKWPAPKRWEKGVSPPMKKEILMTNVENISFEFYVPLEYKGELFGRRISEESWKLLDRDLMQEWMPEWKQEYNMLPAMVKVHLKVKDKGELVDRTYLFPLPNSELLIIYE
jgi:type II secretory pathway component PulJ